MMCCEILEVKQHKVGIKFNVIFKMCYMGKSQEPPTFKIKNF